ncbi:MAG TPA: tryptophan synthase subunit alpha [Clostridia bacterium]
MSRISEAFEKGKVLITYIMAGDPDLDSTLDYVLKLEKAGAGIIELGIPFSDPSADGSAIMKAGCRALKNNYITDDYLELVQKIRKVSQIPIVIMAYANTVFCYGIDRFFEKLNAIGGDGIILPDVSYEESAEFEPSAQKHGIDYIPLVAPTSESRIEMITKKASGFVYCISSFGVTGARESIDHNLHNIYGSISLPKAVGFGISKIEHIKELGKYFDGIIIGSKIVEFIENNQIEQMQEFVSTASSLLKSI